MLKDTLARRLVEIRNKNNLTQETAAELCDLSSRYWRKLERGQASATLSTLEKLSAGLNVDVSQLIEDDAGKKS